MAKKFSREVKLGGLSIGEITARMSFAFTREELDIADADALFSGSRCSVTIEQAADKDQAVIKVNGKSVKAFDPIDAVCDIKGFRTTADNYSAGLTFLMAEVGIEKLARFSGRKVVLTLKRTGDIPEKEALKKAPKSQDDLLEKKGAAAEDKE